MKEKIEELSDEEIIVGLFEYSRDGETRTKEGLEELANQLNAFGLREVNQNSLSPFYVGNKGTFSLNYQKGLGLVLYAGDVVGLAHFGRDAPFEDALANMASGLDILPKKTMVVKNLEHPYNNQLGTKCKNLGLGRPDNYNVSSDLGPHDGDDVLVLPNSDKMYFFSREATLPMNCK